MAHTLAELRNVSKRYAGVEVLRNVSFDVREGEIHALLGGNGAGKSTLVKILAGLTSASLGEVWIGGHHLSHPSPSQSQAMGLYLVPQEAHIFPNRSVLENICIGLPRPARAYRATARKHIEQLGVELNPDAKAATLEIADRQLVEILRGMIRDARVLILDEPTSALTPLEVEALFGRMQALRSVGTGLVFISHKLHEVRQISDRITVLRDGDVVLAAPLADCPDDRILTAMNPRASAAEKRHADNEVGHEALQLEHLSGEGFEDVSLSVRSGEILGLTGVVGAGRTELAETLFGLRPVASGQISVNGQPMPRPTPRRAVDAGLVYLSEDRQQYGLFLEAPLFWNTSSFVNHLLPFILRPEQERARFTTYRKAMDIRCVSPDQHVQSLSGGNQQKVLLSKCLAAKPKVLILDEPTRGVDVGARSDIYQIIGDLAARGTAVLLISSDFDEVERLADRIAVMAGGILVGELPAGASPDAIARLAFESREARHA
jgi:AI-2 transport system ATP-binding protein